MPSRIFHSILICAAFAQVALANDSPLPQPKEQEISSDSANVAAVQLRQLLNSLGESDHCKDKDPIERFVSKEDYNLRNTTSIRDRILGFHVIMVSSGEKYACGVILQRPDGSSILKNSMHHVSRTAIERVARICIIRSDFEPLHGPRVGTYRWCDAGISEKQVVSLVFVNDELARVSIFWK